MITGLSELKHVLTPRIRAFQASMEQLGDYVDAVYDLTLGYTNNKIQGVREPGPSLIGNIILYDNHIGKYPLYVCHVTEMYLILVKLHVCTRAHIVYQFYAGEFSG